MFDSGDVSRDESGNQGPDKIVLLCPLWQVGFRVALFSVQRLRNRSNSSARSDGDTLWLFSAGFILRLDQRIHEFTQSETISIS